MPQRKSNLWPFSSRKTAQKGTCARRSALTVGQAMAKALAAGKQSGDTGLFEAWLCSSGLQDRGSILRGRLKREYERGVNAPAGRGRADELNREFLRKQKRPSGATHKGRKIEARGESFVVPSIDRESEFDSIADAKRFVDSWAKSNPTDRALRYRAQNLVTGPKQCVLCGAKKNLDVMHLTGNESHGEPENLAYGCRSCNGKLAAAFKAIGAGRPTNQYNPSGKASGKACSVPGCTNTLSPYNRTGMCGWHSVRAEKGLPLDPCSVAGCKNFDPEAAIVDRKCLQHTTVNPSTGVPSFEQYAWAVSQQNHSGEHGEAGAIIHATPKHKRIEYARRIAQKASKTKRERADERWNPGAEQRVHSGVHVYMLPIWDPAQQADGRVLGAVHVAGESFGVERQEQGDETFWTVANPAKFDRCVKAVKAKGGAVSPYAVCTAAGTRNPAYAVLRAGKIVFRTDDRYEASEKATALKRQFPKEEIGLGEAISRRNPEASADALYESFHGKPATHEIVIESEVHEHERLAVLGRAVEVWIETPTNLLAHIEFSQDESEDPVILSSSEDGKQLYFEGGDQEVDLAGLKMDGADWIKDRMVLGRFAAPDPKGKKDRRKHNLTYLTAKAFDDFQPILYQHDLGEVTGERPMLEYEPRNKHLFISGGQYFIKQPLFGISPGIEN